MIGHSQQAAETDRKLKEKELKALLARDEELDGLFELIYEAVSYTHLDVYKRQPIWNCWIF